MSNKTKVLFIDDEVSILNSLQRSLRNESFDIVTTTNPNDVFDLVQKEPIAVVVSDQRMPQMEGVAVLEKVRNLSAHTIRIMLTGYADMASATRAINESAVYRFLAKPWDSAHLKEVINNAIKQYDLVDENERLTKQIAKTNEELKNLNEGLESKVLERTREITDLNLKLQHSFLGSIKVMDTISQIHNAKIGAHAKRVTRLVIPMAKRLIQDPKIIFEMEVASLLHDIGKISIPTQILETKLEKLKDEEKKLLRKHTTKGEALLSSIPNLELAPKIIRHHHEYYNGKGYPDGLVGDQIPLGSRIIAVVDAYDKVLNSGPVYSSANAKLAGEFISENAGVLFDPVLVELFKEQMNLKDNREMEVGLDELRPGMQLSRLLKNADGRNIAVKGTVLNEKSIEMISAWIKKDALVESIWVNREVGNASVSQSETKVIWE